MDFATWEPVYDAICDEMGYDRAADERARDRLADLVGGASTAPVLAAEFSEETVAIVAPGPSLPDDLVQVRAADSVLAAGTAADQLIEMGVDQDWIITDLDGHPNRIPQFTSRGSKIAIHAHGDNIELIERVIPDCDPSAVVPTTQATPTGPVHNFGGFTDGDRAAFIADALEADRLTFPGWELENPAVGPEKRVKLDWATRLLAWLEDRRNDRFSVLDGLRANIDLSAIPGYE